mgnify:CR=1 FL=1
MPARVRHGHAAPSAFFRSSFTRLGLALPAGGLHHLSDQKPEGVGLAGGICAAASAFFASTSAIAPSICDSSSICVNPSASTMSVARPARHEHLLEHVLADAT